MSSIQISHRLLSILPFGKPMVTVLKPNSSHYRQYITHIRWSYSLSHEPSKTVNLLKQISILPRRTSIIPIVQSDTSLTTTSLTKKMISKRSSLWQRIICEFKHYYNGFKLLFIDTKTAFHLLHQISNGHTLTRRERKQFTRTIVDLFRLVPFSVFIIVPFMEFTLPIFLKLFPNMLPSTFKQIDQEKENLKKQSKIELEGIKFLQDTLEETIDKSTTIQFREFMQKIRSSDVQPSTEEFVEFSSLFEHQFTLDYLPRPQLIALCKLLNLSFLGPNAYLRLKLHFKFNHFKLDDKLIANEGIENLNIEELQTACHERGMNSFDISLEQLQSQLQQWLDLHIHQHIPILILLLSNARIKKVVDQHGDKMRSVKREFLIDIDRFRIGLKQWVNQKVDFKEYREDVNRFQTFTTIEQFRHRSTQAHSKFIDQLVVPFTQSSDKRQEMY